MKPQRDQPDKQQRERGSLYGAQLWREVQHLLLNMPIGIAAFIFTAVTLCVGAGLAVTVVGLPLAAGSLAASRRLGAFARFRARRALGATVEEPAPLAPAKPGPAAWVLASLTDGLSWRSVLFTVVMLPWGILSFTVTLVCLVVGWPVLPWVARYLSAFDR